MARILITGGSSYLGQHLVPLTAVSHEVCYTFYQNDPLCLPQGKRLDIRDETAVRQLVSAFHPDVIIHTAGSNRVDDMTTVIETGAMHITRAAADVQARLIHLSTDSIFSGRYDDPHPPPYDETALPSPVNAYGRAKTVAEALVQPYDNAIIIRTSLIYGLQVMDHGTAWVVKALRARQPVTLFSNQRRNPIWVETLSQACLELAANQYRGILNVAGRQVLSRAEFSLKMLDWWQINTRDTLAIGPSETGQWPLDCELDLDRATAVLSTPLWGVDEALNQATAPRM